MSGLIFHIVFFFLFALSEYSWGKIPNDKESYIERPDILTAREVRHDRLGPTWDKLKEAHLEAIAMLLESYAVTGEHLYFLARDSELLYDYARLAAKNDPVLLSRIHLINVSRSNMTSSSLKYYLAQEGISEKELLGGKKVVFIDTGFSGTIPRHIRKLFSPEANKQLKTHLMCSSNGDYPSSRAFLAKLNPAAASISPANMHGTIISYEHLPRYTDRSDDFYRDELGMWQAISPKKSPGNSDDGTVSKEKAIEYQEDLKAFALKNEERLANRRALWKELHELSKEKTIEKLQELLQKNPGDAFYEALARDYVEILENNSSQKKIGLEELGLKPIAFDSKNTSNKNLIVKQFPQWQKYLENPDIEILKLIKNEEWATLGAIFDVVNDTELNIIVAKGLAQGSLSPKGKSFIKAQIKKGNQVLLREMIMHTLPHLMNEDIKDVLRALIEIKDGQIIRDLNAHIFSRPFPATLDELILQMVEMNDAIVDSSLIVSIFSKPHTERILPFLEMVVGNIKGPAGVYNLREYVLKQPHTQTPAYDRVREAINIQDINKRREFLGLKKSTEVVSLPHSSITPVISPTLHTPLVAPSSPPAFSEKLVPTKEISINLEKGDKIKTSDGRELVVKKYVDQGKRGKVYQVLDKDGVSFALKVAMDNKSETLVSFAKESEKNKAYQKLGISYSKIIESNAKYILKEWVEGTRADIWLALWKKQKMPLDAKEMAGLLNLVEKSAKQGAYIGDLNVKNLIWREGEWVVVDSGSVKDNLTLQEALKQYQEKIPKKWSKINGGYCTETQNAIAQAFNQLQSLLH